MKAGPAPAQGRPGPGIRRRSRPEGPGHDLRALQSLLDRLSARPRASRGLLPVSNASRARARVRDYLARLLSECSPSSLLCESGSSPLRTYLPTSDVDVVIVDGQRGDAALLSLSQCLLERAMGAAAPGEPAVRSVSFVNAKVRLLKASLDGVAVDVSVNQLGALAAAALLDAVDAAMGRDHLFKRSVVMVKAWLRYESATYLGGGDDAAAADSDDPAADGGAGLGEPQHPLPSYACAVMLLHVFAVYPIDSPIAALARWLDFYSTFDWGSQALSALDAVSVTALRSEGAPPEAGPAPLERPALTQEGPTVPAEVAALAAHLSSTLRTASRARAGRFAVRCCNIVDPVDPLNNVAVSVTPDTLVQLQTALRGGRRHVLSIALQSEATTDGAVGVMLRTIFNRSWALFGGDGAQRPDLQVHPCQAWSVAAVGATDEGDDPLRSETDLEEAWRRAAEHLSAPAPSPSPSPSPPPPLPRPTPPSPSSASARPTEPPSPSSSRSSVSSPASSAAPSPVSSPVAAPEPEPVVLPPPVTLSAAPEKPRRRNKPKGRKGKAKAASTVPAVQDEKEEAEDKRRTPKGPVTAVSLASLFVFVLALCSPWGWDAVAPFPTAAAAPPVFGVGIGNGDQTTCPSPPTLQYWVKLDAPFAFAVPWSEGDTRFRWFKDGVLRRNETSDTFVIPSVSITDAGRYQCVASSARGEETTTVVEVMPMDPPRVNRTLLRRTVREGAPLTLTAHATGVPPPVYQWRKNGVNIPHATNKQFAVAETALTDAGTYSCHVSNIAGEAEWEEVLLNVVPPR